MQSIGYLCFVYYNIWNQVGVQNTLLCLLVYLRNLILLLLGTLRMIRPTPADQALFKHKINFTGTFVLWKIDILRSLDESCAEVNEKKKENLGKVGFPSWKIS